MRCLVWIVTVSLLGGVLGCGGETDEQRLERLVPGAVNTTPVTGNVTVDGQPVKDLWVTLHPKDPSVPLRPRGQTDERGNFRLTTYTGGDGAPTGEYDITIEWLTFIKRGGDWGGPDKLKNQCNDPKTTPYHVTVQDTPIVLPTFELKLEGVAAKPGKPAAPTSRKRER